MDGAGPWQKFRNITIVYLRPAMLPYSIYGFVITFNLFYLAYFMSGGGPFGRTELLVTAGVQARERAAAVRRRAAFAVIMFFILLAADAHHEQAREGDGQLCRLGSARLPMPRRTAKEGPRWRA